MNVRFQRLESFQIRLDLIREYSHVGLNALDEMFATFHEKFFSQFNLNDLSEWQTYVYSHQNIPYIATIKKRNNFQDKEILEIKLNNGEFNYEDSLPSLEKNIDRHKSNTWIKVKYSTMLVKAYMENIHRFIENLFDRYKLNFYYNTKEKRCDLQAFMKGNNSNYGGDLRGVVITFEPGHPYTEEGSWRTTN
jgi:hypothetical protein